MAARRMIGPPVGEDRLHCRLCLGALPPGAQPWSRAGSLLWVHHLHRRVQAHSRLPERRPRPPPAAALLSRSFTAAQPSFSLRQRKPCLWRAAPWQAVAASPPLPRLPCLCAGLPLPDLCPAVWLAAALPGPQAAAQYIEEHNLQKVVEDAINATIKAKPSEPFSFMVRR